jgi:tetratricopeptide (TPR) repeat protein
MKRFADAHRIALTISISLGQQLALMTVVTSLARSGQVEQALMFARQASLVEDRLPLLLAIAVEQMRAHKVDEARNTFGEAKRAVQATKAPQLWSAVVEDEAKAGEFEGAEEDTKEIPTGNREAELAKLVEFEAGAGKFQMALRTAEMIGSEQSRSQAFYVISNLQAKAGDFQTAMRAAERVPNRFTKSLAVTNVIGWQLKNGKAVDVSGAILGLSDAKSRSAAFRKVAEAQVKLGKFTEAQNGLREALKASRQIEDNEDRATAIREVGEAQFQAGMVADGKSALLEAARAAEQVSGSRDHIDAIFESAIDLAHVGFYRDALRAADLCPPRYTLAVYATVLLERAKKSDPRLQEFKPIQDFLPTAFQSSANGTLAK